MVLGRNFSLAKRDHFLIFRGLLRIVEQLSRNPPVFGKINYFVSTAVVEGTLEVT